MLLAVALQPAEAAFPGKNGKIAFSSHRDTDYEIYSINPDGSDPTNVTNNLLNDRKATWSPDGTKVAFVSHRAGQFYPPKNDIYTMDADGSDRTHITED